MYVSSAHSMSDKNDYVDIDVKEDCANIVDQKDELSLLNIRGNSLGPNRWPSCVEFIQAM